MNKYCSNCGSKLITDADYCLGCGKKLNINKKKSKSYKNQSYQVIGIMGMVFSVIAILLIILFNVGLNNTDILEASNQFVLDNSYFKVIRLISLTSFAYIPSLIGITLSINALKIKKTLIGIIGLVLSLSVIIICIFTTMLFV